MPDETAARPNTQPVAGDAGRVHAVLPEDLAGSCVACKIAEEREQRSGELAAILDAVADGLIVYDQSGRIVSINAAARAILDYEEGLLPEYSLAQRLGLLAIETSEGWPLAFEDAPASRALRGEVVSRVELTFQRPSGERRLLSVSAAPVRDASAQVSGAVVTFRDITDGRHALQEREVLLAQVERERTQVAQLAGEARRRAGEINAIFESIADAVFVCDRRGTITKVNDAGLALIGASSRSLPAALSALQPRRLDGRPIRTKNLAVSKALHGQTVRGQEELAVHPFTAKPLALLVSAAPLRDETGGIVGAVEVAADITRLRELAGVAQRRAAELQGVLDNMFDAVLVADAAGEISIANEAAIRLLGFTSFEEMRRPLAELSVLLHIRHMDGRLVATDDLPLTRALAGKLVEQEDEIIRDPLTARDRFLRTSAAPIRNESGIVAGAVEVARDVTELSELERLKDEFISVAAHELKTPVAIMKGYAQALLRSCAELPQGNRKMLDAINRGADRIDRVVQDLLDISRLRLGHLELSADHIDLGELAAEVVDRFALTTQHHRLHLTEAKPVAIAGDRDRLEQVLINLLDNAIKYSPNGGEVEIAVGAREEDAVVSVRDHGIGIADDKQGQIFQRFYRAHAGTPHDYAGMGVGLYISNEIVSRHGGRMWLESKEHEGSVFYFALPRKALQH